VFSESKQYALVPRGVEAYERIRKMILTSEIAQGSLVSEADLVRSLGMSRTPVREALHRLEAENYVKGIPGRGYVVIELSEQDMMNAYRVRAVLEGLAAEHAAALATRTQLAQLDDLYDEMERALERDDEPELTKLNSRFHAAIAEASGNRYLQAMLDNIHDVFERFRATAVAQPTRRDDAHAEHGLLIRALRAGGQDQARALAEQHVRRALEFRREHVERSTKEQTEGQQA
jgi:DNA-binding GntR family transcriptional regulator